MKNAILREVQVLRLRLNWIVHSIFGLFNMCFSFSDASEMCSSTHSILSYGNFVFCQRETQVQVT